MIKGLLDYSEFKDVDMVIEVVIENVHLKQTIFSEIEKVCPPHCILATKMSTIDLNLVGEKLRSQERVVGPHISFLLMLCLYWRLFEQKRLLHK